MNGVLVSCLGEMSQERQERQKSQIQSVGPKHNCRQCTKLLEVKNPSLEQGDFVRHLKGVANTPPKTFQTGPFSVFASCENKNTDPRVTCCGRDPLF